MAELMKKKVLLFIATIAAALAAFTLTACGSDNDGYYEYGEGTKLADVNISAAIPYVTDFAFDYYDENNEKIEDKSTVFDFGDEIKVKVTFTLSADAYSAGKSKFTLKLAPSEDFDGRIYSATTAATSDRELTATFTAGEKPKELEVTVRVRFGYNSGNIRINYRYDDEEYAVATISPLNGSKPLEFTYDKETDGYIVGRADGNAWFGGFTEFVVPAEYKGAPITGIADKFFYDCNALKTVTLPSTLKSIGNEAFGSCGALESVTLPSSVTRIGTGAFAYCAMLKEIVLSDGIEDIGYDAFKNCNKLAYNEYGNNSYLGSPDNAYAYLIQADYKEKTATVHENCKVIGRYAFNCDKRIDVNTPLLTSITLPSGVRNINEGAFYCCKELETAVLPDTVKVIGNDAFNLCEKLKSVTLGDGLKVIGDHAFTYCELLEDMKIPDSVEEVGEGAFSGCKKLRTEERTAEGGKCYYIGTKSNKYAVLASVDASNVVVKDGCVAIAAGAFRDNLRTVVLPGSVKSIGAYAFEGCKNLKSIDIPSSVTTIGEGAFSGCALIENVTIPAGVTTIGDRAFYGSSIKTVTIPEGVKSIGISAFSGCENLETVNFPKTLTELCDGAFSGCKNLKSVTLPDSVERIGNEAFYNCHALTTVDLPERLEKINYRAFRMCISLKNVTWRGNINRIEVQAFSFTHKLREITFIGTRRALLDILSSLPEKSECFSDIVTAHCTDGDLRFGNTCDGEVLIYLSEPVFVKN